MRRSLIPLAIASTLLCACANGPQPLYAWGSYEDLIYHSYRDAGAASDAEMVANLEKDRETARAKDKILPPGWHAHLGYLYTNLGRLDEARAEFETEKQEFPESAVFMDRLLANLARL